MLLLAACKNCRRTITDKQLLQLLEVYPVNCPNCGAEITPPRVPDVADVEIGEEEQCVFDGVPDELKRELAHGTQLKLDLDL